MDRVNIVVQSREATGSRAARRLRRSGLIPGVIYGHGEAATMIAVEPHVLRDALSTGAGTHAVLDVTFEGHKASRKAIVKELELNPINSVVTHVDLQEIRLDETIETMVAVSFQGEPTGVKAGGVLDESLREVSVKGLVTAIPEHLIIDISELAVNDTAKVADIVVPDGIEILDDPEQVICSVLPPRKVEEEPEAGVAEPVGVPTEPEVVGKGEKDEVAGD